MPLGVLPTASYEQAQVPLSPGDRLVMYTDGITEARNALDEEFGEERLLSCVVNNRGCSAPALQARLADAVATCEAIGQSVLVVGHSLGGVTAAALAQHRPDLVKAVVLEDPPLSSERPSSDNSLMDVFRLMRESIPRVQENHVPASVLADILAKGPTSTGPFPLSA